MREHVKKPESQSRTLDSNPKASRQAPIDVILQRYKERNIQRFAEDEELIQGKFETTQCEEIDEDELLQGKFEPIPTGEQEAIQREEKPNNTGLPDNLKSGVENLSGYSMDDVKVHYNSDKPAQLNALAYAQGTDIHVAPGQEKHLPHEAWHVVQQKQGRVQPTVQMQGVNINDNKALEHEADVEGGKAIQLKAKGGNINNITQLMRAICRDYVYKAAVNNLGEINNIFVPELIDKEEKVAGGFNANITIENIRPELPEPIRPLLNEDRLNQSIAESQNVLNFYFNTRDSIITTIRDGFIARYTIPDGCALLVNGVSMIYWVGKYDEKHKNTIISDCLNGAHQSIIMRNYPAEATGYVHVYGDNVLYAFQEIEQLHNVRKFIFLKRGHAQQVKGKTTHVF